MVFAVLNLAVILLILTDWIVRRTGGDWRRWDRIWFGPLFVTLCLAVALDSWLELAGTAQVIGPVGYLALAGYMVNRWLGTHRGSSGD
ncbi:MAG TPA: hypothetical protein VFP72_09760 [Kineosporiaceae bacterium]|nr:hypothetical protein [Kineosporiaceae bacterium]